MSTIAAAFGTVEIVPNAAYPFFEKDMGGVHESPRNSPRTEQNLPHFITQPQENVTQVGGNAMQEAQKVLPAMGLPQETVAVFDGYFNAANNM